MKKTGILFTFLCLFIFASCSNSNTEEEAEGANSDEQNVIEVEIEDASYILSGQDDGEAAEDGGLLYIDLQVENISDNSIQISPEQDIQLYDGDNQIDPSNDAYPALGLEVDTNSSIGTGKQKTVNVMFDVDEDKEYDLSVSSMSSDYEIQTADATVSLDTSEYNDSLESLQDPKKALEAYVETIYFDKDNSDYKKLVSADKKELQDKALKAFGDMLEETLSNDADISESDMKKYYDSFKDRLADKGEVEATVIANVNDKAIVEMEYSGLDSMDLSDKIRDYKEEYRDKQDSFTEAKEEDDYALSKFDKIVDELEAKKADRDMEFLMKKEDGNWVIDNSEMSTERNIRSSFAEGIF